MSNLNPGGLTRVLNYIKTWVTGLLNDKANSSHSHTKSQITDFPTIPTVNNATLTIQKNGTTVNSFTANASSNVTANITVPTKVSELTNDSGYITSHQSLSNYVTLNSAQTITATKTISANLALVPHIQEVLLHQVQFIKIYLIIETQQAIEYAYLKVLLFQIKVL